MSKSIETQPPAKSLVMGIRAIGYNFSTAVADIVDNSISARAKTLYIYSDALANEPYFCFLDDGDGMTESELQNAMLLGSNRQNRPDSEIELGRFGLGLKSASLSQCREFIVATKKDGLLNAMAFDLDEIERTDKWMLKVLEQEEINALPHIDKLKRYNTGTLVIWIKFDRLKDSSKNFEATFRAAVDDANRHAALVFHRFYEKFQIFFDDRRVDKRDPFLLDSVGRQQSGRTLPVVVDGTVIQVTAYTLPFANTLTATEKDLLGNPKSIYDDQGFYIYRNKRLILWGSWMRMGVRSELNKLARILVDVPSSLDSMWSLDVKKSSAKIPDRIKEQIWAVVKDSTARSVRTSRFPGIKELSVENKVWERTLIRDNEVQYSINRDNPIVKILQSAIGKEENALLSTLLSQLESYLPKHTINNDLNDAIKILNSAETEEEGKLIEDLCRWVQLFSDPQEQMDKLAELLASESYSKLQPRKEEIVRRLTK